MPPPIPDRRRLTRGAAPRRLSRRRFIGLLTGGALIAGAPARAITMRTPPARKKVAAPPRAAAIERGIARQKGALAKQLKTLRDFPLPPGSDPAFVFRPVSPRRMR